LPGELSHQIGVAPFAHICEVIVGRRNTPRRSQEFDLIFLGISASVPSAERNHPGLLVEAGGHRILVDCGEGTQCQLLRGGAGFRRLDRLLLTHGHFDHVLGIPGLFSTLGLQQSADVMRMPAAAVTTRADGQWLILDNPWRDRPCVDPKSRRRKIKIASTPEPSRFTSNTFLPSVLNFRFSVSPITLKSFNLLTIGSA